MNPGVVAVGWADVSLTVLIVGAIVLAGATVIMTAVPNWQWPRLWRRRRPTAPDVTVVQPVAQRRVVTGRKPTLPPPGAPLPVRAPVVVPPPPGQVLALPDGRRPTTADVQRAEAVIDEFLESDPHLLAATLASWIAADDRTRRRT